MTQCFVETYDISVGLGEESPVYPGDVPYSKETTSTIAAGANYNLSAIRLSAHSGTHIDAPAHYIEGAKTLDMYPLERFILTAHVIFIEDDESIESDMLKHADIKAGEAVLFKTHNSVSGLYKSDTFSERFVYLSKEAAKLCVDLGISLVGIDYISIERYGDDDAPVHHMLLKNDVLILEGINLNKVPSGRYMLAALPLKIKNLEAAPARAILLR